MKRLSALLIAVPVAMMVLGAAAIAGLSVRIFTIAAGW